MSLKGWCRAGPECTSPKQATLLSPCLCAGVFLLLLLFFFLKSLSLTPALPWLLLVWSFAVTQDWRLITF